MLYDSQDIQTTKAELLAKYQTDDRYIAKVLPAIAAMVERPWAWTHFGPYWPVIQSLIVKYYPQMAAQAKEWGDPPDYLAHYSQGDDMSDCIAALMYLEKDDDYLSPVNQPHSIELQDGRRVLYSPTSGIIEP